MTEKDALSYAATVLEQCQEHYEMSKKAELATACLLARSVLKVLVAKDAKAYDAIGELLE